MTGSGVMRQRHDTHRQPGTSVGRKCEWCNLVVYQIAILAIHNMEVVAHEAAAALGLGFLVEALEAHLVDLSEHNLFLGRDVIDIQAVAHLANLLGSVPTQEQRITRHMQETMLQVVDDINALVSRIGHRIDGAYHGLKVAVLLIINTIYTVGQREEILNSSHIGFAG